MDLTPACGWPGSSAPPRACGQISL